MSKFILKPVFGFVFLLGVSFFCSINRYNRVLVSCVDLLKTNFTISLCELWVNHRFLPLDEYLSLLTRIFFCWAYRGFYHIFWPEPTASFVGKKHNNTASRPWTQFSFEGDSIPKPQIACNMLIVSTSNNKNPVRKRGLAYATNKPFTQATLLKKNCLKNKLTNEEKDVLCIVGMFILEN